MVRALVLGGSGIAVGWLAHTNADGGAHLSLASIPLLLSVIALAWVATLRPVPVAVTAGILGSGQILTHLALSAGHVPPVPPGAVAGRGADAGSGAAVTAVAATGRHGHHGPDLVAGGLSSLEPVLRSAQTSSGGDISLAVDPRMVAVHVLATVALTLSFTAGERILWRAIERLLPRWSLPVLPMTSRSSLPAVLGPAACGLAHRSVRDRAPPA